MRIRSIQLKNGYKRFLDLTIDLGEDPKRIIALIGPNGCGKSSVLDGMLFHANAHGLIGNTQAKDYTYHSMNKSPDFPYTNVAINFLEGNFSTVHSRQSAVGKQQTIFSFRSPYRYNSNLKVVDLKAVPEIRLNDYGASASSDLDAKMEQNYRRLNIKYNKYLHDTDCKPSEAKAKIIADLNTSIHKCIDLEVSSIGNIEASQGTLYFKKSDQPTEYEFNVLSSGEKEVVDILLDLYLRQDAYNETIFLLDEPELHISTSIQKKLLLEINKLIGEKCQLWVATHSIGFLRALQEELKDQCQIIQFTEDMNLASTPRHLTPIKKTASKWKEIFAVALDDLTHLISPKKIYYCEGRDQPSSQGKERGLDAQVFNKIFGEKYYDTLFVSSGGNTELDQRSDIALAILTKVFSTVEIFVLKDRDIASGKSTTEQDRQLYLQTNSTNHRVLKRWEIENYLFDKAVLKKYCHQNNQYFDEKSYDKFITDIDNQNIKNDTARIKNLCSINTSVNPEKFKLILADYITEDMPIYTELEDCIFNRN